MISAQSEHTTVRKATAMDMVDGPATPGFLASPWHATGTSNTGPLRSECTAKIAVTACFRFAKVFLHHEESL